MPLPHYVPTGQPREGVSSSSNKIRAEFEAIEDGIDELNKYVLDIFIEDVTTEPAWYMAAPWDLEILRADIVNMDAIGASFTFWVQIARYAPAFLAPFWINHTNVIFMTAGWPVGESLGAEINYAATDAMANGETAYKFSAGEVIKIATSSGDTTKTRAHVALLVKRTG